jgi:transposase
VKQQPLLPDDEVFNTVPPHLLAQMTKEEMLQFFDAQNRVIRDLRRYVGELRAAAEELKQSILLVDGQYVELKNKLFGKSSEREPVTGGGDDKATEPRPPKARVLLPSQRYPDAQLIEREVTLQELPTCGCCGNEMEDSGMTENSEFLTVIPAQYIVVRQKRHKYRCGRCHGDIKTAPAPRRITPGSSYSDAMIIDAALSKYCDLIPMERYCAIAGRGGTPGLPPQSLIETTHGLADFVGEAYRGLKKEILQERVLHADETPHRMLEGDERSHWYLWGFSGLETSYFECHDTRSGDVSAELLTHSKCEYLMSDVYSGYGRSTRIVNEARTAAGQPLMQSIHCNAHARRYFKQAKQGGSSEAQFFVDRYKEIYRLEAEAKGKPGDAVLELRAQMRPHFEAMRERALASMVEHSAKSKMGKAMSYFISNYRELTVFIGLAELPIDNNRQERLLRSHVVGRKTWYGTHSKRGALTAAILFSLVESCKLIGVNPRHYFKSLVESLHAGQAAYTPKAYKARLAALAA